MEFKPRAIFLDMDGTILNHQNEVSIHIKKMIDELRKKGYFVFIATGRAFDEIEPMVPPGFQVDGVVTSNGMAGYVDGEIVFKHTLPLDLVETIIKKAREHKVYYELFPYGTSRITLKQDQAYVKAEIRDPKPESVGLNEWLSRKQAIKEEIAWKDHIEGNEFSKFYFFARTKEHINSWKKDLEQFKKEVDFTISISSEHNVEVMVANVNKATGVQQMLNHFGLSLNETLAIGDSDNDLPMLRLVHYAVAMKNAPDRIKEIADDVTDFTCDEDGVYHYLKSKFAEVIL
ncbi:haloacid dehalogenase-like hydrolase [Neobacillus bataviensis LMG 21833]|uniref:Haloacid dehalogenase-like hydrolase n=1 Tax=Neobacillus bataviensis LMG 21833 TaxID=1117379 RepID=K6DPL7_9BACI|nr:Cof-type HAD-IIB family hydrolase [Neobacillus bataviensis]EKN62736.1 haloacid dehalogenase-like hydrolase [Neobacillus bataviensis LMG 21833]